MEMFRINELLEEREMTFSQLSDEIGIGRTNLYNYVSETNSTIVVLKKISDCLGISIGELFNKEEPIVRGYLELGDRVYVIDSPEDLTLYQQILTDYLKK